MPASTKIGVWKWLSLLSALALLAACGGAAQPPAGASAPAAVRLGYIPLVIFAPIYVGVERGYFAEEGLQVELTQINATNEAVVQLAAGNFDVGLAGGNAGVFNAIARGLKFTVVAPMHQERPPVATPLVISARRAGEIKTIADLKGGTIGINANGAAIEYWVAQALARGGLTIGDVQLKAMPFPNMPAALENGALDAAVITEPLVTINKDKGLLAVLSDDFIDGFTATYVFMNQPWMERNPQAARGFLKAYLRAARDLQGDYMTPEVAAIVEKYTQVPAAVIERSALAQYDPSGRVPTGDLETLQRFFLERGLLEYSEPIDVGSFVDARLASEVAAELNKQ
jgi:NitT/TauT family transport system substrate-binding protein